MDGASGAGVSHAEKLGRKRAARRVRARRQRQLRSPAERRLHRQVRRLWACSYAGACD